MSSICNAKDYQQLDVLKVLFSDVSPAQKQVNNFAIQLGSYLMTYH